MEHSGPQKLEIPFATAGLYKPRSLLGLDVEALECRVSRNPKLSEMLSYGFGDL